MYSYLGYLLFLFLFFPYCIVGPTSMYIYIYPSPMCILDSFSITIIRDSPFSLSLFTELKTDLRHEKILGVNRGDEVEGPSLVGG